MTKFFSATTTATNLLPKVPSSIRNPLTDIATCGAVINDMVNSANEVNHRHDICKSATCPRCKKTMNSETYDKLEKIMCEFGDLAIDVLKYSSQYGEPNMRAISITIADLEDSTDSNEEFRV